MAATLVDSNVPIDSLDPGSPWRGWADGALEDALDGGPLFVNQIVYAEVSIAFAAVERCDEALALPPPGPAPVF